MKQYTIAEVLNGTAQLLNNIQIPVSLIQQIGTPIETAIHNLNECVKAIEENQKKDGAENGSN